MPFYTFTCRLSVAIDDVGLVKENIEKKSAYIIIRQMLFCAAYAVYRPKVFDWTICLHFVLRVLRGDKSLYCVRVYET